MVEVIEATERDLMVVTLRRLATEFDGAPLSAALDDFGFVEFLAKAPRVAVSALFDALGTAGSMSSAIQDVLLLPLDEVLLDGIAGHSVVLPAAGASVAGAGDGTTLSLRGLVIGRRPNAGLLAPVTVRGELVWARVSEPGQASTRSVAGLDPALGMAEVSAEGVSATVVSDGRQATALWNAVATSGRRALSYQIVAAVGQMIDLAIAHARDRVQFGRPIGSFQAIRNRLADAYVAREAAAGALDMAWDADDQFLAGMLAKSLAGRAARIAGAHCQQVLAGIGFTAEHPFHRFLARALVLDSVLGSATELPKAIGAHLDWAARIPRLVEL
jgi:hypothetical protein